jgi:hypothetical protein
LRKYPRGGRFGKAMTALGADSPLSLALKAKPQMREIRLAAARGTAQLPALSILRVEITFSSQPIFISGTDDSKRSV